MTGDCSAAHRIVADTWLAGVEKKGGLKMRSSFRQIVAASEGLYHLLEAGAYTELDRVTVKLVKSPGLIAHLWRISGNLFRARRYGDDLKVLELSVKLSPEDSKAQNFLGNRLEKVKGKGNAQALTHYQKAFRLAPARPESLANLGRCLLARKEVDTYLAEVEGLPPATRETAMNDYNRAIYADALARRGRGAEASKIRMTAIEAGSKHASYYADEARWLHKQGQSQEALRILNLAEKNGAANDHTRAIQASILEDTGNPQH